MCTKTKTQTGPLITFTTKPRWWKRCFFLLLCCSSSRLSRLSQSLREVSGLARGELLCGARDPRLWLAHRYYPSQHCASGTWRPTLRSTSLQVRTGRTGQALLRAWDALNNELVVHTKCSRGGARIYARLQFRKPFKQRLKKLCESNTEWIWDDCAECVPWQLHGLVFMPKLIHMYELCSYVTRNLSIASFSSKKEKKEKELQSEGTTWWGLTPAPVVAFFFFFTLVSFVSGSPLRHKLWFCLDFSIPHIFKN